jgi:sulfite reductase beta subunit-like hemoprotein
MPMMVSDGFMEPAFFARLVSLSPGNADFGLQSAVSAAVGAAALSGLQTCTVATAAYANVLVQAIIERLVNMGYTATLSGTTLTVNWSVM